MRKLVSLMYLLDRTIELGGLEGWELSKPDGSGLHLLLKSISVPWPMYFRPGAHATFTWTRSTGSRTGLKVMFVLICIHASLTDFPFYSTWNNLEKKNNSNPSPSKSSHWQMPLWPSDLDGGSMASFVSSTGCAGHYGTRNRCQMGQPSFIGREQKVVIICNREIEIFF